jgi:uncharacterized repeat protein (TIGR03803 family)
MARVGLLRKACIILVACTATTISADGQAFTTLFSFDKAGGYEPNALIQASDGNFYGTTYYDGANGGGTVFRITPAGTLTTLYTFCAQTKCADGAKPWDGLVQATDGNFYGTTYAGGTNGVGTVFQITPTGALTTLHSFTSDGSYPKGGLIQALDGNLYGTTSKGGAHGGGIVFQITVAGTLTTLYSFCAQTNCSDGTVPWAGVIQGNDGNFYGTTQAGGANGYGTVFRITPTGTLTTLHSFKSTDGSSPEASLISDYGIYYGTTAGGGAGGYGTLFEIYPQGFLRTLYNFHGTDGMAPWSGLIPATDGTLYGTTPRGGAKGNGTVFQFLGKGAPTTLYSFCAQTNCSDGTLPGGLVQATDGSIYGTTFQGGANRVGTVFRLSGTATLSPSSLNFGNQVLNQTSAPKLVTLKNGGMAPFNITGIAVEGSGFVMTYGGACSGAVVGPKVTCQVYVAFTPTTLGKLTGTLTFTDSTSNSPQTVPLSGIGVEPATLTPMGANYGSQALGSPSVAKTFALNNNQNVALTNIAISTIGDFAVSATTCGASLAAKSKCTIGVTFTPTTLGTRTGQLSMSGSVSNSPQTASLTGTGVEPATLTPASVTYRTQALGTTSPAKTFTLANNQSVALTSIDISTTGDFAMSATTCTTSLATHGKCTISVTFSPIATGTRTGKLTVSDSANNSPQTSTLTGTSN